MSDPLVERFRQKDRRALARLLTFAARGEHADLVRAALGSSAGISHVVAVTGSAGVGKSTLIGRLIDLVREQGQTIAVLACDPQSPLSGGALLGDRFRMPPRSDDEGLFVRSLATVSGHGAVAEHLDTMIRLLESFGFDWILIETVGAGQGDTAVRDLADVLVLLLQPEAGDDLQWEKAGVLEVADIIVIHKADLPRAHQVEAQVKSSLELSTGRSVPVLRVSSKTNDGLEPLWAAIAQFTHRHTAPDPSQELLRLAQQALADRFVNASQNDDAELQPLIDGWRDGTLAESAAVDQLLELLVRKGATGGR
jgi:LAO/AO transport system ATPase